MFEPFYRIVSTIKKIVLFLAYFILFNYMGP